MSQSISHNLILAIKSDELAIFAELIKGNEDLSIGRFPILSICYMYNAKKIIKFYNELLLNINTYKVVEEEFVLYKQLSLLAGKSLRLYVGDKTIITPLEMMAIMHKDNKCKKAFKLYKANGYLTSRIVKNLNYIYSQSKQKPDINGDGFKISFRPLSRVLKIQYRIAICISLIFMFAFAGSFMYLNSTVGFGTVLNPYKVYMESQLISAIRSNSHVILTKDISITENISDVKFSGSIDGDGHTLFIENVQSQLIQINDGLIKNLNIKYNAIEKNINNNFSLLVDENNGDINNINILCDNINMVCDKSMADMYISGFANKNTGKINGGTIKMVMSVQTSASGDCYVSGIVGKNTGEISGCQLVKDSSITTFEADISGICSKNEAGGKISKSVNYAQLAQTSSTNDWSPNVAGITMTNYGEVSLCKNYGDLKAESTNETEDAQGNVFVGGISVNNYGTHTSCLNSANLTATSKELIIYCGGISAYSSYWDNNGTAIYGVIEKCGTSGTVNVSTENALALAGGICGFLYGDISNCYSLSIFTSSSDEKHFFGTALGSASYSLFGINISATNNFALTQDNVSYQIGALINNGSIVRSGANLTQGIISTSESEIKTLEIYWV